ncbi:MAG: prolyl oligopeptidase family serine peptidase [Lachnospiraceae bacterium]
MYNSIPAYAELAKRGFAMAMVQVRESELAVFPAQVTDIKKAIRFLFSIAEQFHIDTENIFIAGDSSGGHLALLTGLTATTGELDEDFERGIPLHMKGIIDFFGPTDLFLSEGDGPIEDLLGTDNVNHVPELTKSASCKTYISAEREIPPILMFHGLEDELVSIEHSRSLFACLQQFDKEVQYYEIEKENHGGAGYWGKDVLDIVEGFLRSRCIS